MDVHQFDELNEATIKGWVTDEDHCPHCGLLVCSFSPCCEAWEKDRPKRRDMQYVIVVDKPDGTVDVVGPWCDPNEARWWEDRKLDAPAGSRALIVPVQEPDFYLGESVPDSENPVTEEKYEHSEIASSYGITSSAIERARKHREDNPPPTS